MTNILNGAEGSRHLLMGNEAIARGALEAGVSVIAGYPGTPSSEIIETLAKVSSQQNLYVEWSVNEKVAMEVAAAGSFAGLRTMAVMKQNGVNVGSDFLLHLALTGTRGGMVLVHCDDPGAWVAFLFTHRCRRSPWGGARCPAAPAAAIAPAWPRRRARAGTRR